MGVAYYNLCSFTYRVLVAELLYSICKTNEMELLRYDYNEPQKGKDQCDRESAIAKGYLNAFINSGNDCMSANDIKNGVLFLSGSKDSKVSVVEIDKSKTVMQECKILNISTMHSIAFQQDSMSMWQYYDCGDGKVIKYAGLNFKSGLVVLEPFEGSHNMVDKQSSKKKKKEKKRGDRELCNGVFCKEPSCLMYFNTNDDYKDHINEGNHIIRHEETSMYSILLHHADLLIKSSSAKSITGINPVMVDNALEKQIFKAAKKFQFNRMGIAYTTKR